jgi:hypothetical protein
VNRNEVDRNEDALVDRLRSLRELSWDRPDHRRSLEQKIMDEFGGRMRRWRWLTGKAALFVGLVVLGGMAAGATTLWIVQEISVEPGTPDGQGNCTWIIHHEDGSTEETEPLPEDSGWLTVDDEDGGGSTLLGVTRVDPSDAASQTPAAAPAKDGN